MICVEMYGNGAGMSTGTTVTSAISAVAAGAPPMTPTARWTTMEPTTRDTQ